MLDRLQEGALLTDSVLDYAVLDIAVPLQTPLFRIVCFGKKFEDELSMNWRLPSDTAKTRENIAKVLHVLKGKLYFALNTSETSASRINRNSLRDPIILEVNLFGNKSRPADAVILDPHQGLVLNPAGCGVLCAEGPRGHLAVHVAWRGLINMSRVLNAPPPWRLNDHIAEMVVRNIASFGAAKDVRVWLRGFLPHRLLPYPLRPDSPYAKSNGKLLEYITSHWGSHCVEVVPGEVFYIRFPTLAQTQLEELGVRDICTTNSYLDAYHDKALLWSDGRRGKPRNFMVVMKL